MALLMHWAFSSGIRELITGLIVMAVICTQFFVCVGDIFTDFKCYQMIIIMFDIQGNRCIYFSYVRLFVSLTLSLYIGCDAT